MDGEDCHSDSIYGLNEFRELFRMPKLEDIPNFNNFKWNEKEKRPSELQRRQISEFTFAALQGDYDAVYLDEVKRSIHGDKQSDLFIGNLIPRSRYGKATEKDLITYKEVFATKEEVASDELFNKARNVDGHH